MKTLLSLCAACLATLPACKSAAEPAAAARDEYVLVYLLAGPSVDALSAQELEQATAGHFENMARLGREGVLLVAGPLFEPRADPADRGIFVFDLESVSEAEAQAATDPAVQAGVFEVRALPLRSEAALRTLHPRHLELDLEFEGDMQRSLRAYVLATAPEPERALERMAPLEDEGRVLFSGTVGAGADRRALFALDAETLEDARDLIAFADPEGSLEWTLSPWYATRAVAELPALP